jgi:sugar phosphate isomerase/epimerase
MRRVLSDNGLAIGELDPLVRWIPGLPGAEAGPAEEAAFYAIADAIGGRSVNAILGGPGEIDLDRVAEAFAAVCDRAAAHGLAAHLEFSRARTPADVPAAARVVAQAARPNAGLMVDAWHVHWGAGDFSDLRELPGSSVTGVQICDAPAEEPADFAAATRHQRLLPGAGVADLGEMLAALEAIGSHAPLCIESFDSERVAAVGAVAYAQEMADAARQVLAGR